MKNGQATISLEYQFHLPDGSQEVFVFHFDAKNLELLMSKPSESLPSWTHLSFYQCSNCPLTTETHPHCPCAANIVDVVSRFDRLLSYEKIHMTVVAKDRIISQETSAQQGVSSLMGLIIANSDCPHTSFFRPMAWFHQPLANVEETIYRAATMYLLSQYFLKQEGKHADFDLQGLEAIYHNIHIVNTALTERLRAASTSDLPVNAVILLDLYAMDFPYRIEKILQSIRYLFTPFLDEC